MGFRTLLIFLAIAGEAAATPTETNPGVLLADAYDALFNDLTMVSEGSVGVTRVPNDLSAAHLRGKLGKPDAKALAIVELRAELRAKGYAIEEGVIGVRRTRQVYEPDVYRKVMSPSRSAPAKVPSHTSPIALWISSHNLLSGRKPAGPSLFSSQNRSQTLEEARHTAYGNRAVAAIRKDEAKPYLEKIDGWTLYARSVPFRKPECLRCHTKNKVGATAAIVAVAYKKTSAN